MAQKRNILMLYPKIPQDTYWSFSYALPYIGKKAPMPPLGLATVAAMLPDEYDVKIVDMNVEELKTEDLEWADQYWISSMIMQKESHDELVKKIRQFKKPVVEGGPYPTQYFNEIHGVDCFVLGEAEAALAPFISDLEEGKLKKAYARPVIRQREGERQIDEQNLEAMLACFGDNSDIKVVGERPSMALSPAPRFDLLKMHAYMSMAVQISRGCPHNCDFCNEPTLYGHDMRLKPAENIVQEFELIYDSGFHGSIFIVDDNLIGNKKKLKKILPAIIEFQKKRGYPFPLYTEVDISLARDNELMEMMKESGFTMVFTGLESPQEEVLRSMGKHQNVKINLSEAVRAVQSHGMEVTAGFIVGNDNDPPDICDKIFDFCQHNGIVTAMVGLLTAMKGSQLYERLKKEGRLRSDSKGNNTHEFRLNFERVDEAKIVGDYMNLLSRLYDRSGENFYVRAANLFKRLGSGPTSSRKTRAPELLALAKSLIFQPFESYGRSYMKFSADALLRHRQLYPKAIHIAVSGEHLIKITRHSLEAEKIRGDLEEKASYYELQLAETDPNMFNNIKNETEKFLKNIFRKIQKMPDCYRNMLMEHYRQATCGIDMLLANYRPA
jgi:radical SAM superfamily enzyme YgiQ (UPF0313 family)